MNPLDLRGPDFLLFYFVLACIVLVALYVARSAGEGGHVPRIDTSDPYLFAYLRGGKDETLRVAMVALIDRGALQAHAMRMSAVAKPDFNRPLPPLDRAMLRHFSTERAVKTVLTDPDLARACRDYEVRLIELGLLPGAECLQRRRMLLGAALAILVGVAAAKILIAFSRGRTNVGLLLLLALLATLAAWKIASPRLTERGRTLLADVRRLFRRLRQRAFRVRPGGATGEAILLAAVFGLGTLPTAGFAYAGALFRPDSRGGARGGSFSSAGDPAWSSESSSSSSASSCSSSSCGGGSSGSSGCGGCGSGSSS